MKNFYFTYGTDGHPFFGGWTIIAAQTRASACAVFRAYHPDKIPGILNCCSCYSEEEFEKTEMNGPDGNFGYHTHEVIMPIPALKNT